MLSVLLWLREKAEGRKVPRPVGDEAGEPCADERGKRLVRAAELLLPVAEA